MVEGTRFSVADRLCVEPGMPDGNLPGDASSDVSVLGRVRSGALMSV